MSGKHESDSADDTSSPTLGDIAEAQEPDDSTANSDLHAAAREVAEDADSGGPSKTPGA